jgi:hypothetical protein
VQAIFNPGFLLKGEELSKLIVRGVETGFQARDRGIATELMRNCYNQRLRHWLLLGVSSLSCGRGIHQARLRSRFILSSIQTGA